VAKIKYWDGAQWVVLDAGNADTANNSDTASNADMLDGKHSSEFISTTEVTTAATANKLLKLNAEAKLPASITGDADTVDGKHASSFMQLSATPNTNGCWDSSTTAPTGTARLNYSGYLYATRVYNAVYNDYAEFFKKDEEMEPGDIVAVNPNGLGYIKSREAYSHLVVGVVSDEYAHCIGAPANLTAEEIEREYAPVAMSGRVYVKVTGSVKKGELLVASPLSGMAMSMDKYIPGAAIGKALEDYNGGGTGRVRMLVMLA